jgi:hypothetical protein
MGDFPVTAGDDFPEAGQWTIIALTGHDKMLNNHDWTEIELSE